MHKEENMEIRTLETFIKGVKEEGASEPCKYVQFNRQEAQRLLNYVVELQVRIDKAIEYIGLSEEDFKLYDNYDVNGIELLKILKGDEDE